MKTEREIFKEDNSKLAKVESQIGALSVIPKEDCCI